MVLLTVCYDTTYRSVWALAWRLLSRREPPILSGRDYSANSVVPGHPVCGLGCGSQGPAVLSEGRNPRDAVGAVRLLGKQRQRPWRRHPGHRLRAQENPGDALPGIRAAVGPPDLPHPPER